MIEIAGGILLAIVILVTLPFWIRPVLIAFVSVTGVMVALGVILVLTDVADRDPAAFILIGPALAWLGWYVWEAWRMRRMRRTREGS